MPPRITRKSYRPRASDRTMVDNVQPRSLSCFRIRKRHHENRMDLRRANNPEPLTMTWAGERSEHFCSFQSPGLSFLLTLPFIERAYRTSTVLAGKMPGNPTIRPSGRWRIESEDNFRFADYWKVDVRSTPLLPLLNGLNIAGDLIQVRKVVTGQQSQHNVQGFRP